MKQKQSIFLTLAFFIEEALYEFYRLCSLPHFILALMSHLCSSTALDPNLDQFSHFVFLFYMAKAVNAVGENEMTPKICAINDLRILRSAGSHLSLTVSPSCPILDSGFKTILLLRPDISSMPLLILVHCSSFICLRQNLMVIFDLFFSFTFPPQSTSKF